MHSHNALHLGLHDSAPGWPIKWLPAHIPGRLFISPASLTLWSKWTLFRSVDWTMITHDISIKSLRGHFRQYEMTPSLPARSNTWAHFYTCSVATVTLTCLEPCLCKKGIILKTLEYIVHLSHPRFQYECICLFLFRNSVHSLASSCC